MSNTPDRPRFLVHASVVARDAEGRVLVVQEEKPASRGKWNLPGGHVDHGEPIADAAERELREETGLRLALSHLVGVYQGPESVRFVFGADCEGQPFAAGHEILDARLMTIVEIRSMPDEQLVSPRALRAILRDVAGERWLPLGAIRMP